MFNSIADICNENMKFIQHRDKFLVTARVRVHVTSHDRQVDNQIPYHSVQATPCKCLAPLKADNYRE